MPKTRIIGLGNPILSDDSVGLQVARALRKHLDEEPGRLEVVELFAGGFPLLDAMVDWDRVALVDAIHFRDVAAGTVVRLEADDLKTSLRVRAVHQIDLPMLLALGDAMGVSMPSEIVVYGVQGDDMTTFGEGLTPAVQAAIPKVVAEVMAWLPGVA